MYLLCLINHRDDSLPLLGLNILLQRQKYSSAHPFTITFFPIRGVLLFLWYLIAEVFLFIHCFKNLTQRGCLYLLFPSDADHAIEQCNQFVQQELVFHYLVHKIKQLQCLSAHCYHKTCIGTKIITDNYNLED